MTGAMGAQAAGNVANAITSGAAATAAGTVGATNALNNGPGAVNSLQSGYMLNKLLPTASAATGGSTLYGAPSASSASGYNIGNNPYNFQMPS